MALAALILAVIAIMLWAFTAGANAYLQYRYVLIPWRVMRADVAALNAKLDEQLALYASRLDGLDEFTRASRIQGLTDEEAASRERRYRAKRASQQMVVP